MIFISEHVTFLHSVDQQMGSEKTSFTISVTQKFDFDAASPQEVSITKLPKHTLTSPCSFHTISIQLA
jgi:hypothetical protein